mmetsp:Transcript_86409/g.241858  ORF Transcript_86409/g.241858 Transcript_86409/m.241858 type:complete len:172 (+) Transcript_86409:87-602(+)
MSPVELGEPAVDASLSGPRTSVRRVVHCACGSAMLAAFLLVSAFGSYKGHAVLHSAPVLRVGAVPAPPAPAGPNATRGDPWPAGASAWPAASAEEERRLGTPDTAEFDVFCVCRKSAGHLYCGGMYYTLQHCGPRCPAACRRMGLSFDSCEGKRQIQWYRRLHYSFVDCRH